jgi:hypothetical protein
MEAVQHRDEAGNANVDQIAGQVPRKHLVLPLLIACGVCVVFTLFLVMFIFGALCLAGDPASSNCGGNGRAAGYTMLLIGGAPFYFLCFVLAWNSVYFACCCECWRRRYSEITL